MHSSDGGISLPPAIAPTLVSTKSLDLIVRGVWPFSEGSVRDRWIPSTRSLHEVVAPSEVNLQCAMLISNAAYTHSMTKVSIQLFV